MKIQQIDHLNLSVTDLEQSVTWYQRVLGFAQVDGGVQDGVPWAIIRAGDAMLALYHYPQLEHHDRFELRNRGLHGLAHFALRITDREAWQEVIANEQLELLYDGVVEWPHSTAWYIADPTGYEIEIALWHNNQIAFD